jgi:hypothetical protein
MENEDRINGWYAKPHCLIALAKSRLLTKSEYILLDLLLHCENKFTGDEGKWFFHSDKDICSTKLISSRNVVAARRSLKDKGFINYKKGYSHNATEYLILGIPEEFKGG